MGAGKKAKPLADKLLDGNPGRRKLKVIEFSGVADMDGVSMPPPREFLSAKQRDGKTLIAVEIYETTWNWLNENRCAHLVPGQLIEQYAMSVSRWIQCEEYITDFGFLAKHPTTGNAMPSPYVAMSQTYMKQVNNIWYQIYQIVRENCATEFKGISPQDDAMERLLSMRKDRR
ncbi:MAG: P27 family phage terminase small subunit [Bacillota bacterium]